MSDGYKVSPELLDQIYRVVRDVLRGSGDVAGGQSRFRGNPAFIAYTTSTISARSGTTPGTGTAQILYLTDAGVYANSGDERTVYNHGTSGLASGSYVLVAMSGGRLEVVLGGGEFDECGGWIDDLTTSTTPDVLLGLDGGCIVRVAVDNC